MTVYEPRHFGNPMEPYVPRSQYGDATICEVAARPKPASAKPHRNASRIYLALHIVPVMIVLGYFAIIIIGSRLPEPVRDQYRVCAFEGPNCGGQP